MNKHFNPDANEHGSHSGVPKRQQAAPPKAPDKTAAWPGLPGKKQGRTRDRSGTKKVRTAMREEI